MRKTILFLLMLALTVGLVACSGGGGGGNPVAESSNALTGGIQTSEVRGKITGEGDLGGIMVYLVADGANILPDAALRAQTAGTTDGQLYFTSTDPDGSFVFPAVREGMFNLIARKDRYNSAIQRSIQVGPRAAISTTDLVLRLTATGDLTGVIQVPTGYSPVTGIVVFMAGTSYSAFTDAAGKFTITGVPVGTYTVAIMGTGLVQQTVNGVNVLAAQATTMNPVTMALQAAQATVVWKGVLAAAPASPQTGWAYYNTGDAKAYIWNGTAWDIMVKDGATGVPGSTGPSGTAGVSIVWKGSLTTAPADPQLNWAYYNSTDAKTYLWDGSAWQIMAQDGSIGLRGPVGVAGPQGPTGLIGATGTAGISLIWKGTLTAAPANPQTNWAYYNSTDKKSYVWDGTAWQVLAQDGGLNEPAPVIVDTAISPSQTTKTSAIFTFSTNKQVKWILEFTTGGQTTMVASSGILYRYDAGAAGAEVKNLSEKATYSYTFTCTDLNGLQTSTTGTYTHPDKTAPTISSVVPVENATVVPVSSKITVVFNEPMTDSTLSATNITVASGQAAIAGTLAVSSDKTVATFTPNAVLPGESLITVTVSTGVKDAAGNALEVAKSWTFTTADVTPPTVQSVIPSENATAIASSTKITVIFNEPMDGTTLTTTNITLASGSTALAGTLTISSDKRVATFTPAITLPGSSLITATVSTGAKDAAGNAMASAKTWTFTTAAIPGLRFDSNGGTGMMADQEIANAATVRINKCTFTRAGYAMVGWATTAGGAAAHLDGVNYTGNGGMITLFAVWEKTLLTNSSFLDGQTGWTASKWNTPGPTASSNFLTFSYQLHSVAQEVSITNIASINEFKATFFLRRALAENKYRIRALFYDSTGAILKDSDSGLLNNLTDEFAKYELSLKRADLGTFGNITKVRVELYAQDGKSWAGYYGPVSTGILLTPVP